VSNACVKVGWVTGKEELSVISIQVVVKGQTGDESAQRSSVHDEE